MSHTILGNSYLCLSETQVKLGILHFYLLNLATRLPGSRPSETTNHTTPWVGARGVVSAQTIEAALCVSMHVTCVHVRATMRTGMVLCVCATLKPCRAWASTQL